MDRDRVRDRRRPRSGVFPRPVELWTYRVWRRNPMRFIALRDSRHRLERRDLQQKGETLLDADGIGLRDLAVFAGSLDLLRSLSAPRGA